MILTSQNWLRLLIIKMTLKGSKHLQKNMGDQIQQMNLGVLLLSIVLLRSGIRQKIVFLPTIMRNCQSNQGQMLTKPILMVMQHFITVFFQRTMRCLIICYHAQILILMLNLVCLDMLCHMILITLRISLSSLIWAQIHSKKGQYSRHIRFWSVQTMVQSRLEIKQKV